MLKTCDPNEYTFEDFEIELDGNYFYFSGSLMLEENDNFNNGSYEGCYIDEIFIDFVLNCEVDVEIKWDMFSDKKQQEILAEIEKFYSEKDKAHDLDDWYYENMIMD